MTETRTARFELPQWSNKLTDGPSMADFNEAFLNIETWAARDEQGTLASRPAPSISGRYYTIYGDGDSTLNGTVYRDNGAAWTVVGSKFVDAVARPSAAGSVPLTSQGIASQTGDLMQWKSSVGLVLSRVTAAGALAVTVAGSAFGAASSSSVTVLSQATAVGVIPVVAKGILGQTADLQQWQTSAGGVLAKVAADGALTVKTLTSVDNGDPVWVTGNQTIAGTKTFSTVPETSSNGQVATLGGAQTFTGAKTFDDDVTFNDPVSFTDTEAHSGVETHSGTETHSGKVRFSHSDMQPKRTASTTDESTTSTSFVAGTNPVGLVFKAPPSGCMKVHFRSYIAQSIDGQAAICGIALREGASIGSGGVVEGANSDFANVAGRAVNPSSPALSQNTQSRLYQGLNPGADYNLRIEYQTTAGGGCTVTYREIWTDPVF